MTALLVNLPLASSGRGKKKCLSTEHSTTCPVSEGLSRKWLYAAVMVAAGVKLIEGERRHRVINLWGRPPNLPILADCVDHGLGNDLSGDDSWEDDVDGDVFFLVYKSVIFARSVSRKLAGELDDAQVPEWEPCTVQNSIPR